MGAAFSGDELALAHIEATLGHRFPFVEAGTAEGDAFGAGLTARLAFGVQVNDVVHGLFCN